MTAPFSKFIKAIALTFVITVICLMITLTIGIFLLNENQQNRLFTNIVSTITNSQLNSKQLDFSYQAGKIVFKAQQLSWEKPGSHIRLETDSLKIICSLASSLTSPITVHSIILQNPTIDLSEFPITNLRKNGHGNTIAPYFLKKSNFRIENGRLFLPHDVRLSDIDINVTKGETETSHSVKAHATGKWQDAVFPISAKGTIKLLAHPDEMDLQLLVNSFPLKLIKANDQLRFEHGTAVVKSRLSSKAGLKHFILTNDIEFSDIQFLCGNQNTKKSYQFDSIALGMTVEFDHGRFHVQSARLKNKSFTLNLSGHLDINADSPLLDFRLASEEMTIPVLKQLLPDPFLGQWLTTELFPRFTKGKAVLNNLHIRGTLEEIAHMDRSENRHTLGLNLTLKNTVIILEQPDVVFFDSSGHLQMKNGKLLISDISGKMKDTTILQGSYQIDNLFEEEMTTRFSADCQTTLTDLARFSSISYMPEQLREDGQLLSGFSGHVQASIQAYSDPSYDTLRFDQFEVTIKNVTSDELFQGSPVTLQELIIKNDNHSKNILTGTGKWKQSDFSLSGFFRDDGTGNIIIDTRFDIPTLFPFIDKPEILPGSLRTKTYPARFSVQKQVEGFLFDGHITLPEAPVVSSPEEDNLVKNSELTVKFTTHDWKSIDIDTLSISYSNILLKGSGKGNLDEMKATFDIRSAERINFASGSTEIKKDGKNTLQADLKLEVDLNEPRKSQIFGKLQGRGLDIPLPGIVSPAKNVDIDLLFSGNGVELKKFNFFLNHSQPDEQITVTGHLEQNEELVGSLVVDAKSIHWNDIFNISPETGETERPDDTTKSNISIDKQGVIIKSKIRELDLEGLLVSPLYIQGNLLKGKFYPTQIAARTDNGRLGMLATPGEVDKLQFSFFIKDQKLDQLDRFFPYSENRDIKGRLTIGGTLHSQGNTIETLRAKLNGSVTFDLQEATLKGNYILVRLLELLSIENLFSKKADYAEDGDLYIKSIKGNLSIDDSILTCNDIFIDTIAFDASGDFRVDLKQNFIESHLAVSPFGTVDTVISTIPIIGHILTGKNKSLVSYHFMIRGQLPEPEISYIPLEDIPSSILGYGERLLSPSTYLFFLNKSEKEKDYDRESEQLVEQIVENFISDKGVPAN